MILETQDPCGGCGEDCTQKTLERHCVMEGEERDLKSPKAFLFSAGKLLLSIPLSLGNAVLCWDKAYLKAPNRWKGWGNFGEQQSGMREWPTAEDSEHFLAVNRSSVTSGFLEAPVFPLATLDLWHYVIIEKRGMLEYRLWVHRWCYKGGCGLFLIECKE